MEVNRFCVALREHSLSLSVVYFAEWVDRWLMGDEVPGPDAVEGRRYSAVCLSPEQAMAWADGRANQFSEQHWFASRLREAATAWDADAGKVVVILREVVGASASDVEVCMAGVPEWLSALCHPE